MLFKVSASIQFNDEFLLNGTEIDYIRSYGMLPTKFDSHQSVIAQNRP